MENLPSSIHVARLSDNKTWWRDRKIKQTQNSTISLMNTEGKNPPHPPKKKKQT